MQASPLQLEIYFLKDLSFSLTNDLKKLEEENIEFEGLEISIKDDTTSVDDDPRRWHSEVVVEAKSKTKAKVPYVFKVVMAGFFSVDSDYPEERAKILAETNAPAILYSSIREIIINLTSRSPYPNLLLPSITFLKPPEEARKPAKKLTKKITSKGKSKN